MQLAAALFRTVGVESVIDSRRRTAVAIELIGEYRPGFSHQAVFSQNLIGKAVYFIAHLAEEALLA